MNVTDVRIKLVESNDDRLQAFCAATFDNSFVVRDIKIIGGPEGSFIAMPSRKIMANCPKCGHKNHVRAGYCNQCGGNLSAIRQQATGNGHGSRLYADIAHPINPNCRRMIEEALLSAYARELQLSKQPGYKSQDLDMPE